MEEPFNRLKLKNCCGIPGYSWYESVETELHHNERQLTIIDAIQSNTEINQSVYLLTYDNESIFMSQRINRMLCRWFKFPAACLALVRLRPGPYKCVHFCVSHAALGFWTPSFGERIVQSSFPSFVNIRSSFIIRDFLCDFVLLELRHSHSLFDLVGNLAIENDKQEVVFNKTFNVDDAVCVFKIDNWSVFAISLSSDQEDCNSKQFKTYLRQLHRWSKNPDVLLPSINSHQGLLRFKYSFDMSGISDYDWYILAKND